MSIKNISWAVPPNNDRLNRPSALVRAMTEMGAVDPAAMRWFHGRSTATEGHTRTNAFLPGKSLKGENFAMLSPLFLAAQNVSIVWTDIYDDWAIAPDINPVHRIVAKAGYQRLASCQSGEFGLITVNSQYMARKIGLGKTYIVPNGVDPRLGELKHGGDDKVRLLILGHFFRGRTDLDLLSTTAMLPGIQEVVIAGTGSDPVVRRRIADLQAKDPTRFKVIDWLSTSDIASLIGRRTVALIPNLVSDYTLSQDLMKAYTFMALGVPTICPAPLWPNHISKTYAFLSGHGDNLARHFQDWLAADRPSTEWRMHFCRSHSWASRAEMIVEGFAN